MAPVVPPPQAGSLHNLQPISEPLRGLEDLTHHGLNKHFEKFATFGDTVASAEHNYHEMSLFSDDALVELLSTHPRRRI